MSTDEQQQQQQQQQVEDIVKGLGDNMLLKRQRAVRQLEKLIGVVDPTATTGKAVECGANGDVMAKVQTRVLALCQDKKTWQKRHGGFLALKLLCSVGDKDFRQHALETASGCLEDEETRVRLAVADCLEQLAELMGIVVYERLKDALLTSIETNFTRSSSGASASADDASTKAQSSSGGSNDEKHDSTSLFRAKPKTNPSLQQLWHDTAGWKSLETSWGVLQRVMAGTGKAFTPYLDDALLDLVYRSVKHLNRFVRETAYYACGTIASICDVDRIDKLSPALTKILATGLSDNWSQVRYAASVATRTYLQRTPEQVRSKFYTLLLPPMALNRYYVAEGVRLYSITTWKDAFGQRGKDLVAEYITEVATYYISQSQADNHAVREAACHCIAELGVKIDKDALKPHVQRLLETLLICFKDESWPVRDAACGACGNFVASFPPECKQQLPELYKLWFAHICDNIPSVRQGTAVALGKVLGAYKDEALQVILPELKRQLPLAKEQKPESKALGNLENNTTFGVAAKKTRDNDPHLHSNQVMYSCGSLAPKLKRGSGCMDHGFKRPAEPWESSDGSISLLVELAAHYPDEAVALLPELAEVASKHHYAHHFQLLDTFCKQLPILAKRLGKKVFKRHMQQLLDPLFYALKCGNHLTMSTAGECIAVLAKFVGPTIFKGRLSADQREEFDRNPNVQTSLRLAGSMSSASSSSSAPRRRPPPFPFKGVELKQ